MNYLEKINKPLFLDEKRTNQKIKKETNANIDYGFKHYTLKETSNELLNKLK